MQFFLILTHENKLVLNLQEDKYYRNPEWAVNWVRENIPSKAEGLEFSTISGSVAITDSTQILSCLETWININSNSSISKAPPIDIPIKVTPSSRPPEGKFLGEILAVSF